LVERYCLRHVNFSWAPSMPLIWSLPAYFPFQPSRSAFGVDQICHFL
jgi:hypothetical protein